MALVTWGCYMLMGNETKIPDIRTWLRANALHGPSSHVHSNGDYKRDILQPAELVTDEMDTILCPNSTEVDSVSIYNRWRL